LGYTNSNNGYSFYFMPSQSHCLAVKFLTAVAIAILSYGMWTFINIRRQAARNEAQAADCIVVLGAAQYNGRPSPVLKARLDHAAHLFRQGLATHIITTGGFGPDKRFSEAGTARDYLIRHGIPGVAIEADPSGETTLQSARTVKSKLDQGNYKSCILVSDGFHLFRSKAIFARQGITVFASPAPGSPIENSRGARWWYSLREVFVYTAFRVGIRI
jgi:uncharacterized SAM-binding protein YcdF (DUF218 family)